MKFIKLIIVFFLTLSTPSLVFGDDIKDVGLFCELNTDKDPYYTKSWWEPNYYNFFWFEGNGKLKVYFIDHKDIDGDEDNLEIIPNEEEEGITEFKYNEDKIFIYFGSRMRGTVDRFTLIYEEEINEKQYTHSCILLPTKDEFNFKLYEIEDQIRGYYSKRKI
jgi:hypothetical protein